MIHMIVASTAEGVIGNNNVLPWHIEEELNFFKSTTEYSTLLMGYNTYKSLPKELPNREIIVLTHRKLKNVNTIKLDQLDNLFAKFKNSKDILFISGGKQLYESFYQMSDRIYHSIIKKNYVGDKKIDLDYSNYQLTTQKKFKDFVVNIYDKNKKI